MMQAIHNNSRHPLHETQLREAATVTGSSPCAVELRGSGARSFGCSKTVEQLLLMRLHFITIASNF